MRALFDYKLIPQDDFATRVEIRMTPDFWKQHGAAVANIQDYPLSKDSGKDQFDILIYHASEETPQSIELFLRGIQAAGILIAPGFANNSVVDGYALEFANDVVLYAPEVDLLKTFKQAKARSGGNGIFSEQHPHYLAKLSRNELNFQQKMRDLVQKPYLHHCDVTITGLPAYGRVDTRKLSFAIGHDVTRLPENSLSAQLSALLTQLAAQESQLVPEVCLDSDRTPDGDLKLDHIKHSVAKAMQESGTKVVKHPATYYYREDQILKPLERSSVVDQPLLAVFNAAMQQTNHLTALLKPYERNPASNKSTLGYNYRVYVGTRLIYSFSTWTDEGTATFLYNMPRILSAIKSELRKQGQLIPPALQAFEAVPYDEIVPLLSTQNDSPPLVEATVIGDPLRSSVNDRPSASSRTTLLSSPPRVVSHRSSYALLAIGVCLVGTGIVIWSTYTAVAPLLILIGGGMVAYGLYLLYANRGPATEAGPQQAAASSSRFTVFGDPKGEPTKSVPIATPLEPIPNVPVSVAVSPQP